MSGEEQAPATAPARPNVVPITPPVEATLRILVNSVPYLIGAAVVRQPPGTDAVVAQVGRMPWLYDRRLTTLQLPDDTLAANRAVALDWPVPFQAEWIGAPPRLLIARLVAHGHTVGVLLGTLITRDAMSQQSHEAIDLSCELIASAVSSDWVSSFRPPRPEDAEQSVVLSVVPDGATPDDAAESTTPAPEPAAAAPAVPARGVVADDTDVIVDEIRRKLDGAADARTLGRVLRDAMSAITDASAFSVSLFHLSAPEVAYRYKVVGPDRDSSELGRQSVDDGPTCYAARHDRRWHTFSRELTIRDGSAVRTRDVAVLQLPMQGAGEVFGVVTLQTFRAEGFSDPELRLVASVVEAAAPTLATVRLAGRFQPASSTVPSPHGSAAAAVLPPAVADHAPSAPQRTADAILGELLQRCAGAGFATAFLVGVDPGAGVLRGEVVSGSDTARELDYALGIGSGKFAIPLDDRYNAIARAVREARIVPAPTMYEITQPALDRDASLALERLARGGRTVTLPLVVEGEPAGALVLGPMIEDPTFTAIETVRGYVEDATRELAAHWRAQA